MNCSRCCQLKLGIVYLFKCEGILSFLLEKKSFLYHEGLLSDDLKLQRQLTYVYKQRERTKTFSICEKKQWFFRTDIDPYLQKTKE